MTEFTARVQILGRVVIPDEVRKMKGIKQGDFVTLELKNVRKHLISSDGKESQGQICGECQEVIQEEDLR